MVNLEQRAGFEPAVLGICSPLHWATLPPLRCLERDDPALAPSQGIELPMWYGGFGGRCNRRYANPELVAGPGVEPG